MRKAYLVGVGPGSPELVTPAARRALAEADLVLGWDLDLQPVADCIAGKKVFLQDVNNYVRATRRAVHEAKKQGAVLAVPRVGDPCLSSGLKGLLRALEDFRVQIVPGISSIQIAAALARINLDESVVISFHEFGDPEEKKKFMLDCFQHGRHLILLASPDLMPGPAAAWLIGQRISARTEAWVCSFLTLPQHKVVRARLEGLVGKDFPWLSVMVVINPSVSSLQEDHRNWRRWRQNQKKLAKERS